MELRNSALELEFPAGTTGDVVRHAAYAAFGRPMVTNVHRSLLVESAVSLVLMPDWKWCAADYASFDFQHEDGTRLEVKQSSALQSWASKQPSRPSFDIAPRTGQWVNGTTWVPARGRNTDIYLFAHHPIEDREIADHRDPYQWMYYLLLASSLKDAEQKKIGLPSVQLLGATALKYGELRAAAESLRRSRD